MQVFIKKISLFLVTIIICFYHISAWSETDSQYKLLVIHSYHRGDKWSDDLGTGIKEGLDESSLNVNISYEYMDSQKYPEDTNSIFLYHYYSYKYISNPPDIVVVTDENALKFILRYHDLIFHNIPVVFCGIKYFDENLLYGETGITGVVENVDIGKNIELAKKLNPKMKELLIVVDNSDVSIATIKTVLSWLKKNPIRLNIRFTPFMTMRALKDELVHLQKNSAVLLVNFTMDKNRHLFSSGQSAEIISKSSPVPVYTLWDNYLSQGILGGHLIRAEMQGRQTAELIYKALKSDNNSEIPILHHFASQYLFDHNLLKRYKIDPSQLPPDSMIINKPHLFYEQYKSLIYRSIIGGLFLVCIIIFLSFNIVKRRRIENELKQYSKRLNFLYKVDEMILESPGIDTMGKKTLDLTRTTFNYEFSGIIIKGFNDNLHVFASSEKQENILKRILQKHKAVLRPEFNWPNKSSFYGMSENIEMQITQIRFKKEIFGVLIFGRNNQNISRSLAQVNEDLARSMATAISNIRLFARLNRHQKELKQASSYIIHAQENERKHLSRELHDELGQALTAVGLTLGLIKRKLRKSTIDQILNHIERTEDYIKKISEQVHDMSLDLRPPMLDDLGLVSTVRWYLHHYEQRTGLKTDLKTQGNMEITLSGTIAVTLYRILQETLNNVIKHARATKVEVLLRMGLKEVSLYISDNGKGFVSDKIRREGIGFFGMRERLESVGGNLKVHSSPNSGTTVNAIIMLEENNGQS